MQAAGTRRLTQRRTDAAGEFREIIRLAQPVKGVSRVSQIGHIVPLGNQIVQRTACEGAADGNARLAERHAAVHAARALCAAFFCRQAGMKLTKIPNPLQRGSGRVGLTVIFHETGCFSHVLPSLIRCVCIKRIHFRLFAGLAELFIMGNAL